MCSTIEEDPATLKEKFPVQSKEADEITEIIASSFISSVAFFSPFASVLKESANQFVKLKIRLFKLKLQAFDQGLNLEQDKINRFFSELTQEQQDWLGEYLIETLYSADEREKCRLYGFIFHEMILKNIPKTQARRLICAIQNTFIEDLRKLVTYVPNKVGEDEISIPLQNVGLLLNVGFNGGVLADESEQGEPSGTVYILSARGELLLEILKKHKWFCNGD